MVFSPEHVRPRDPVGRMFDLRRLSDGQRDRIGAGPSLPLLWSRLRRRSPEDCMSAYRQFMMSVGPLHATAMTVAPVDTAQLHDAMRALRQAKQTTAWWTSHKDAVLCQKVRVRAAVLEGSNITSATPRALSFSVRNIPYHPSQPRWSGVP